MSAGASRWTFGRHSIGVMKRGPTAERLEHETRNLGVNMDEEIDRSALPIGRPRFAGVPTRTLDGSQPDWQILNAPKTSHGAPNVLLVLIDDAGFGNPSTFGGKINRVVFDINPHLSEADRQSIHQHEQRAALAHGIGA